MVAYGIAEFAVIGFLASFVEEEIPTEAALFATFGHLYCHYHRPLLSIPIYSISR
jgi:hypothetical protein